MKHDRLYPRQALIAHLIVLGCSYPEIAGILKMSRHGVAQNVRVACERAGLPYQDRMKLAVWWLKSEGLIQ